MRALHVILFSIFFFTISLWYPNIMTEYVYYHVSYHSSDYDFLVQVLVINWRINMIKYQANAGDVVKKHTWGLCNVTLVTGSFIYYIS